MLPLNSFDMKGENMTYKTSSDSPAGAIDEKLLATFLADLNLTSEEELFFFLKTTFSAEDLAGFIKPEYNLMVSSQRVLAIAKDKRGNISRKELLLEKIKNVETTKSLLADTIKFFPVDSPHQPLKYNFINKAAPFKREYLPAIVDYIKKLKGGFDTSVSTVDQALAKISGLGLTGQKEKIKQYLLKDEQIINALSANASIKSSGEKLKVSHLQLSNKKPGIFIITSKRVFHVAKVLWDVEFEQISLDQIDSVEFKTGMFVANLRIYGRNNIMEVDLSKDEAEKCSRMINNAMELYKHPSAPTLPVPQADPLAQIQKLAELKEQGVLSEEEFNEKKQQLLSRL